MDFLTVGVICYFLFASICAAGDAICRYKSKEVEIWKLKKEVQELIAQNQASSH